MYKVENNTLMFNNKPLGDSRAIFVDSQQSDADLFATIQGFIVRRLPVGDYVFTNMTGSIIGIEEKRTGDLDTSYRKRRLQRQLRRLLSAVSIPIFGFRGEAADTAMSIRFVIQENEEVREELLKWQVLGGLFYLIPPLVHDVARELIKLRSTLTSGRHLLSIVSGTDLLTKKQTNLTPCAQGLRRLIRGIGAETGTRLASQFHENLVRALSASDAEWLMVRGVHKGILKGRRALLDGCP